MLVIHITTAIVASCVLQAGWTMSSPIAVIESASDVANVSEMDVASYNTNETVMKRWEALPKGKPGFRWMLPHVNNITFQADDMFEKEKKPRVFCHAEDTKVIWSALEIYGKGWDKKKDLGDQGQILQKKLKKQCSASHMEFEWATGSPDDNNQRGWEWRLKARSFLLWTPCVGQVLAHSGAVAANAKNRAATSMIHCEPY